MDQPPVILLAFADYGAGPDKLEALKEELKGIQRALEGAAERGLCEFDLIPYATVADIVERVERFGDRLVAFHVAGHADGYRLMLEAHANEAPGNAYADELAPFLLSKAPHLKLVFLNGCSTQRQVDNFLTSGTPLVVATSQSIADTTARDFAVHFYQRLAAGATVEAAFQSFEHQHRIQKTAFRGLYRSEVRHPDRFPWDLYPREGARTARAWSLLKAKGDCLLFLPPLPPDIVFPKAPFKNLRYYERDDARVFFGRSCLIKDLFEDISSPNDSTSPLLLLYGQSGVGKSSVLQAGLLPRLESVRTVHYYRRPARGGLIAPLLAFFRVDRPEDLKAAWRAREREAKGPLLVIADQVEEVFTHPDAQLPDELTAFGALLQSLFTGEDRVAGKVILSFREEYLARVQQLLEPQVTFPARGFLVGPLTSESIHEVVNGLSRENAAGAPYQLTVEPGLDAAIARDLSRDPHSAVAPVLQILLTKLWEEATGSPAGRAAPVFSLDAYQAIRREGDWLHRFFRENIDAIQAWRPDVVTSGLVFDLLYFLTTARETTGAQPLDTLLRRYGQFPEPFLRELIDRLKDHYLLSAATAGKGSAAEAVRLTHDILAPLIREAYHQSDRPGQKAARLLYSKLESGKKQIRLNEPELAVIDSGAAGMPQLTAEEAAFVADSRTEVLRQRRRNRLLRTVLAAAVTGLLVFSGIFYFVWKDRRSDRLLAEGRRLEITDPTLALEKKTQGWRLDPEDPLKREDIYRTYRDNLFYRKLTIPGRGQIRLAALSPSGEFCALTYSSEEEGFAVYLLRRDGQGNYQPDKVLAGPENTMAVLLFSTDNTFLYAAGADHVVHQWNINLGGNSRQYPLPGNSKDRIESLALDAAGRRLAAGDNAGGVAIWHTDQPGAPLHAFRLPAGERVGTLALHPSRPWILAGTEAGAFLLDTAGHRLPLIAGVEGVDISAVDISPDGRYGLAAAGPEVTLWEWTGGSLQKAAAFLHPAPVRRASFTDSLPLLMSAAGKQGFLWSLTDDQRPLRTLRGHRRDLEHIALTADLDRLFTAAGEELFSWPFACDVPIRRSPAEGRPIVQLAYSADGKRLITADPAGTIAVRNADDFASIADYTEHKYTGFGGLAVAGEAGLVVSGDRGGWVHVWQIDDRQRIDSLSIDRPCGALSVTPDGRLVLILSRDTLAFLWNRQTGQVDTLAGHHNELKAGALSPDGRYALTGALDSTAVLWDARKATTQRVFPHNTKVLDVDFVPNTGHFTATTESDTIYYWSYSGRATLITVTASTATDVKELAWHPEGHSFAIRLGSGEVELLDKTGELIRRFLAPASPNALAFHPGGGFLAASLGRGMGQVAVWRNDRLPLMLFLRE